MRAKIHNFLKMSLVLILLLAACDPEELGTIRRVTSLVEYGSSLTDLSELTGTKTLLADSAVRVTNGGEAELDFGNGKRLRVFNDSDLDVHVEVSSGVSTAVSGQLHMGVVTGEVAEQGDSTIWETPGGATITISGTEYFVAYDPDTNQTFVGNFGGTVEAFDAGNPVRAVPSGEMYELPAGIFYPLPPTRTDFEDELRLTGTPLRVVDSIVSGVAADILLMHAGEPFSDSRVRDAVLFGAPWTAMAEEMVGTNAIAAAPLADPADRVALSDYPYDPDLARALLQEAGYETGGDDVGQLGFVLYIIDDALPGLDGMGDTSLGYLSEIGLSVDMAVIPPDQWDGLMRELLSAGDAFWVLVPGD